MWLIAKISIVHCQLSILTQTATNFGRRLSLDGQCAEAALGGLLVERGDVVAGMFHHLHHAVEGHAVAAVGVAGVDL